jgi:ubiquitin C-terminal hydrolase
MKQCRICTYNNKDDDAIKCELCDTVLGKAERKMSEGELEAIRQVKELEETKMSEEELKKYIEKLSDKKIYSEGLVNLGNTCYMNATIQMLRDVRKLGFKWTNTKTDKTYILSLNELIENDYYSQKLLTNIFYNIFQNNKQQDPHELLQKLNEFDFFNRRKDLIFQQGRRIGKIVSDTINYSFCLELAIPDREHLTIQKCFDDYIKEEKITFEGKPSVSKFLNNFRENQYLFIQLKRYEDPSNKKLNMVYPDDKLEIVSADGLEGIKKDLPEIIFIYKLIGVIIHTGENPKSGHYTYYSYNSNKYYNDESVNELSFIEKKIIELNADEKKIIDLINHNGYIFLYKKDKLKTDGKKLKRNIKKSLKLKLKRSTKKKSLKLKLKRSTKKKSLKLKLKRSIKKKSLKYK